MNPECRTAVWYAVFAAEYVRILSIRGDGPRKPSTYDAAMRASILADTAQYELEQRDAEMIATNQWSTE